MIVFFVWFSLSNISFHQSFSNHKTQFDYRSSQSVRQAQGKNNWFCSVVCVFSNISFQFLRHINLRDNRLEELNDGILVMDGLEKLNVSQNKLVKLPAPIGSLSGLADLDISYNEIREVPNDFGKLKLKKLGYAGNKLKVLIVLCACVCFLLCLFG